MLLNKKQLELSDKKKFFVVYDFIDTIYKTVFKAFLLSNVFEDLNVFSGIKINFIF